MTDAKPSFQTFVDEWRETWRTVDAVYQVQEAHLKDLKIKCERAVADGDAESLKELSALLTKGKELRARAKVMRDRLIEIGMRNGIIAVAPAPEDRQRQILRLPSGTRNAGDAR